MGTHLTGTLLACLLYISGVLLVTYTIAYMAGLGQWPFMEYLVVAGLGAVVGLGELVSRYRDAPWRALCTLPAGLYLLLNACASVGALQLIHTFEWNFAIDKNVGSGAALRMTQMLVAGIGAMALFRSSLFHLRVGEQDVGVGPSAFLEVVLSATDRAVDRTRAQARAEAVVRIMEGVVFTKAQVVLPAYCLALMQNLSPEDQTTLGNQVTLLAQATYDDASKALLLGLALLNLVGEDALRGAVRTLGARIQ